MNPTLDQPGAAKPKYFTSWQGYSIPFQPYGPITFSETKTLAAFYQAYYGDLGRLARFVKYLIHRKPLSSLPLATHRIPGGLLFFPVFELKAVASCPDIAYESTEGLAAYFEGRVTPTGDVVALVNVTRECLFDDNYTYWPNGKLREKRTVNADGTQTVKKFDESGKPVQ
jgi:hypothetical protein